MEIPTEVVRRISATDPERWSRISRTVNGVPVDIDQIRMLVEAIFDGLALAETDVLLDVGCGNGALSAILAPVLFRLCGFDPDVVLLEEAQELCQETSKICLHRGSLPDAIPQCDASSTVSKALIYGVFAYVPDPMEALRNLRLTFPNLNAIFIGQLPDYTRKEIFLKGCDSPGRLASLEQSIGRWFKASEIVELSKIAGWSAEIRRMPLSFYSAHYRFDVVLRRR